MTTTILIPVFNRPDYTTACLDALGKSPSGLDGPRVVLVSNGSRGSTLGLMRSWAKESPFPTEVVEMERNSGFSGGVNAGLPKSLPGRVLVMHNDVIVTDGWAGEMSRVMDAEEDAGVVVARTNYANEQSICVQELRKRFEAVKPSNKERLEQGEIAEVVARTYPDGLAAESRRVAAGAKLDRQFSVEIASHCMLVREGVFEKYGKFDEDFFPRGFEDKFWFQALEWDGLACVVANRAYVHHFGNITSDGPGFSFPDAFRINEQKFKRKTEERLRGRIIGIGS